MVFDSIMRVVACSRTIVRIYIGYIKSLIYVCAYLSLDEGSKFCALEISTKTMKIIVFVA